jgi:hypothetical protein
VTQARRARARPSRLVVPLVAAAVLLAGGTFAAVKISTGPTTPGQEPTPRVAATELTASPTGGTPSSDPTTTPSSSSSTTSSKRRASGAAEKALAKCQRKVRAADNVLAAAKTGVSHWATHVQAQTDANQGKISAAEMSALFSQTRRAGPADQRRYADAVAKYQDVSGSCAKVKNADPSTAAELAKCDDRARAEKPVLTAAAPGMRDWRAHLAAMQRSREGHVANPQAVWIAAWRAAPVHINAYQKAARRLRAPAC